jgi:hypothetical protein
MVLHMNGGDPATPALLFSEHMNKKGPVTPALQYACLLLAYECENFRSTFFQRRIDQ